MKVKFLVDVALREAVVNSCIGILLNEIEIDYKLDNYNFFYSCSGYDFLDRTKEKVDITLYPSYNVKRTPEQLSRAIRTGSIMVATHAEQIINPALYEEKLNTNKKYKYSRQITSHFVWGPFFADLLMKHAAVPADKIYITGNPKLEISTRLNSINDKPNSSKNVLIVSDFSLGDMDNEKWAQFKKQYKVDYKTNINKHYYQARQELVHWILTAAESFPDIKFNVRVHPGEDKSAYDLLKSKNNVFVVGDRDFITDVLETDLVFSYSSTSLFEVLIIGKQVFNLDLYELPEERKGEYFELFEWISKDQFLDVLRKYKQGEKFKPSDERIQLIEKYMHGGNDKAILRNVIAIKDVLENQTTNFSYNDYLKNYKNIGLSVIKDSVVKLGVWLNDQIGIENYISKFAAQRQLNDSNNPARLNIDKINSAGEIAKNIITDSEIEILKNELYEIRKEKNGIYIDL